VHLQDGADKQTRLLVTVGQKWASYFTR